MQERRSIPRWEINREAKLRIQGSTEPLSCRVEDMNLKGMRVGLSGALPEHPCTAMEFAISDSLHFHVEVSVPWKRQKGTWSTYGLEFGRINDMDREKLYQYLNSHFYQQFQEHWWNGSESPEPA